MILLDLLTFPMSMIDVIIIVGLLLLTGHFKGRMDAIDDEGIKQIYWPNKYDFTKSVHTKHWWYFGLYTPKFPERFPFSSTALVFLTDRWHRNQFLMLRCIYLAIAIAMPIGVWSVLISVLIIMPILVGIAFEVSYIDHRDKIFNKKLTYKRDHTVTGDEPYQSQVTSVPEKGIGDQ